MTAGSLSQLIAKDSQDLYHIGNPQITFFKTVYSRYTNFSVESIDNEVSGIPEPNQIISIPIQKKGDLLSKLYLEIELEETVSAFVEQISGGDASVQGRLGYQLIDYIDLEIGGQLIERMTGTFIDIYNQLTHTNADFIKLNRLVNGSLGQGNNTFVTGISNNNGTHTLYSRVLIPIPFWFTKESGLALPLVALKYHNVNLKIKFRPKTDLINANTRLRDYSFKSSKLWCDYIFLDIEERRRFSLQCHEYLIEQTQNDGPISTDSTIQDFKLRLNHPVKELFWIIRSSTTGRVNSSMKYTSVQDRDIMKKVKLIINHKDRFKERDATYFRILQPFQFHTNGSKQGYSA